MNSISFWVLIVSGLIPIMIVVVRAINGSLVTVPMWHIVVAIVSGVICIMIGAWVFGRGKE